MSDSWEKIAIVILFAISPFILYGVYRLMHPVPRRGFADTADEEIPATKPAKAQAKPKREKARINRDGGSNVARNEPTFVGEADKKSDSAAALQTQATQTEHSFEQSPPPPSIAATTPEPSEATEVEAAPIAAKEQPSVAQAQGNSPANDDTKSAMASMENTQAEDEQTVAEKSDTASSDMFPELDTSKLQYNFFYTVKISFEKGVSTTAILDLKQTLTKAAPNMFQTTFCYDQQNKLWETPRPDRSYRFLAWSIPLCNRSVHLNKDNIASIVSVIQKAMRGIYGYAEFPPHNDIENRLHQVGEFCDMVDQTVSLVLQASAQSGGQPRSTNDIMDLALSWGMEMVDNQLRKIDNGETWYTLGASNGKTFASNSPERKVASLVVALDFPHVSRPLEAFDEMFEFCNKLAKVLNFQIVDSSGNLIEQDHVANLRAHMNDVRSFMIDHEVTPGSKTARALFN